MVIQASCLFCGGRMPTSRTSRRKFCSDTCKLQHWKAGKSAQPCHYCGCPADSVDHVPPRAYRPAIIETGLQARYPFTEVYACRECNVLLGARALWTLPKRKKFIKRALRLRYRKLLRIPEWTDSQKDELGRNLRGMVEAGDMARRVLMSRLTW